MAGFPNAPAGLAPVPGREDFSYVADKVLTHKFILHEVWGGEADVQYLRIYIRTLRQKLEADPERPALIITEQGVGYRLRVLD